MFGLVLSLISAYLIGSSLLKLLLKKELWGEKLLIASITPVFGLGVTSVLYFLWILTFKGNNSLYPLIETIVAIFLAIFAFRKDVRQISFPKFNIHSLALLSICIYALIIFILLTIKEPYGSWDGLRLWNTSAKFMNAGDNNWLNMFKLGTPLAHPDYPLLLPGINARMWNFLGNENIYIPAFTGVIFMFLLL